MVEPGIYDNRRTCCRESWWIMRSGGECKLHHSITQAMVETAHPSNSGPPWGHFPDLPTNKVHDEQQDPPEVDGRLYARAGIHVSVSDGKPPTSDASTITFPPPSNGWGRIEFVVFPSGRIVYLPQSGNSYRQGHKCRLRLRQQRCRRQRRIFRWNWWERDGWLGQ